MRKELRMTNESVTLKQINDMKHAIGFDGKRVRRRKYVAYRNYYTTSDNSSSWDALVELGLAVKRPFENGIGGNPQCYFVTKKGMEFLERLLECKIMEEE